jgi:uncharacterized protein YbaR (Trm112 family)
MKKLLIEYLACPKCNGVLDLGVTRKEGEVIVEGVLSCGRCVIRYPRINSIPRFLVDIQERDVRNLRPFI